MCIAFLSRSILLEGFSVVEIAEHAYIGSRLTSKYNFHFAIVFLGNFAIISHNIEIDELNFWTNEFTEFYTKRTFVVKRLIVARDFNFVTIICFTNFEGCTVSN